MMKSFLLAATILLCQVLTVGGRRLHEPYYYWYNMEEETAAEVKNPLLSIPPCPRGKYRELGNDHLRVPGGLRGEGCIPCPAGRYGDSTDLTNSQCSGACPRGTYLDYSGAASIDECKPCPQGTYGDREGLTTEQCSGLCTDMNTKTTQYYSNVKGIKSRNSCKVCPQGYRGWQCDWPFEEITEEDHHHEGPDGIYDDYYQQRPYARWT